MRCADTRHFPDVGSVKIVDHLSPTVTKIFDVAGSIAYTSNDRFNNHLLGTAFKESSISQFSQLRVGDLVVDVTPSARKYIKAGTASDARPMFFSFTDSSGGSLELESPTVGDENRNLKYFSARALMNDANVNSLPATTYPSAGGTGSRTVLEINDRVEHNVKQLQDFFRVMGAIIREMKYDSVVDNFTGQAVGTLTAAADADKLTYKSKSQLVDRTEFFDESFIGATLEFTSGSNDGESKTISDVIGSHILKFDSDFSTTIENGDNYKIVKNNFTSSNKYVDHRKVGTLSEVHRARIDRFVGTYANDLQTKLQANKPFLVTIGDGVHSIGDFNIFPGQSIDLGAILNSITEDATLGKQGGTIYIKRGTYSCSTTVNIRENMHVMGDGPDSTIVNMTDLAYFRINGTSVTADGAAREHVPNVKFSRITVNGSEYTTSGITGRTQVIAAVNDSVYNMTLDDVRFRGGSYSDTNGVVIGYAVDLGTTNYDVASRDIKILNSRFEVCGGGIQLQGARNVKINNCVFVSEDFGAENFTFEGMLEGITLTGPPSSNSEYNKFRYGQSNKRASGDISITNCSFSGKHTADTSSIPRRAWIYLTSQFTGPNVNISNCNFTGDILGSNNATAYPDSVTYQTGTGILNMALTNVSVSNCNFASYTYGITQRQGNMRVSSCSFVDIGANNIEIDDASTSVIHSSTYGSESLDGEANLFVEGCEFKNYDYNSNNDYFQSGIHIAGLTTNATNKENDVVVKNCYFDGLEAAMTVTVPYSSSSSSTFPVQCYSLIDVSGCTFKGVNGVIFQGEGMLRKPAANSDLSEDYFFCSTVNFSNNTVIDCSKTLEDCVVFSAETVSVIGNVFRHTKKFPGFAFAGPKQVVLNIEGSYSLDIDGNKFLRIGNGSDAPYSLSAARVIEYINVGVPHKIDKNSELVDNLGAPAPRKADFNISNNTINSMQTSNIHNGVRFYYYASTFEGVFGKMTCDLTFNNNVMEMTNMNFGLVSKQMGDAGSSGPSWHWDCVSASNNQIKSTYQINDPSVSGFGSGRWDLCGNTTTDSGTDVAGKPYAMVYIVGGATSQYIGVLDFQCFSPTGSSLNACNNTLKLGSEGSAPYSAQTIALGGINSFAGIRTITFPKKVVIKDNVLVNCPVIVKHNFNPNNGSVVFSTRADGYVSFSEISSRGYVAPSIDISNNQIDCEFLNSAIDINPATGFVVSEIAVDPPTTPPVSVDNQTTLILKNNRIKGFGGSSYSTNRGVVRLWHEPIGYKIKNFFEYIVVSWGLTSSQSGSSGTSKSYPIHYAGLNTPGFFCSWDIKDNILIDSIIHVTKDETGIDADVGGDVSPTNGEQVDGYFRINGLKYINTSEDVIQFDPYQNGEGKSPGLYKFQRFIFEGNTKIYNRDSYFGNSLFGVKDLAENNGTDTHSGTAVHYHANFFDDNSYIKSYGRLMSGINHFQSIGRFDINGSSLPDASAGILEPVPQQPGTNVKVSVKSTDATVNIIGKNDGGYIP